LLNETVNEKKIFKPNEILNEVRLGIINSLKQTVKSGGQKDGMDIALLSFTFYQDNILLQYAGANNSMYIIRKAETPVIEEIEPDSMPVSIADSLKDFTNNELTLQKGDSIYIFTDGFADQFGGPKGKKFKYPPLKNLLVSIHQKPMEEQKEILRTTITEWRGDLDQVDDILIIGVRV
jgi:serine phosphatase RsbU (regulator of sigma subunit)